MTNFLQNSLSEFLAETDEMLERIISSLALVEKGEHNPETLNSVYRDMHTLKGSAQLFGYVQMSYLAHSMETCLDPIRNGYAVMSGELVDVLYLGVDILRQLAESVKNNQNEVDVQADLQHIIPRLAEMMSQIVKPTSILTKDLPGLAEKVEPGIAAAQVDSPPLKQVLAAGDEDKEKRPRQTPLHLAASGEKSETATKAAQTSELGNETIRVQVGLLDNLMNLVGELVLIRNQVIQHTNTKAKDPEFVNLSQRLNIVTTELQNDVMKTRMQPIGNILSKFQRIVRDISRELGKEINLRLEGTETELDKTVIEAVKDPLTHIIRNAVDHGIENANERREAGKSPIGQISLRSYQEGGQVVIEIADDGRGLDRKKISQKSVEKGFITNEALEKMSDREINNLIFLPGFSTADKVSNISGRGVGMDVVRTNIEKIGGIVDIHSVEGSGMSIRLKIPLTLAIVPALLVRAGNECFAIPQVKLLELVRVEKQDGGSANEIQMLQGQPVFRLRGNLLPLVSLSQLLKLDTEEKSDKFTNQNSQTEATNIAVLNADSTQFGLIVDAIEDSTDIVVKPLSAFLKNLGIYSGATVLGDGSVALVLDVIGLATRANIFDNEAHGSKSAQNAASQQQVLDDITEYLIVDIGANGRYGIPLCLVSRLEEFKRTAVEHAGDQRVIRYRGSILPTISIADHLALKEQNQTKPSTEVSENISVVVIERSGRSFGLEVNAIIDVIAIDAPLDTKMRNRPSILGTSYHNDGVVVIIDVYKIIDDLTQASGGSPEATQLNNLEKERRKHHLLLVEDNAFFRKHIQQILTEAGFQVTSDINGEEAFNRLKASSSTDFSLVVSDIEMPKMNGLKLAESIRKQGNFSRLPLLALTTKSSDADIEIGLRSGFTKYLKKLDAEQLLFEIDDTLGLKQEKKYAT